MPIELWLAFVAASAVLLVIPGPTILTVISYSLAHGRRANVPLVAAVALGDSTALVVSLLGLGALLATSAFWFTIVKWLGGTYLLFLGFKLFRASLAAKDVIAPVAASGSRWRFGGRETNRGAAGGCLVDDVAGAAPGWFACRRAR